MSGANRRRNQISRKTERQRKQTAHRDWTTEQDEVGVFSQKPLTVATPEQEELCMAEIYSRHLSSVMEPQLFITIAPESPVPDEVLQQIFAQGMRFYTRNKKGVSHLQAFSVDGEQPIRNLSGKKPQYNHLHAIVSTDATINTLNLKKHIQIICNQLKGAAKKSYRGQIATSKSICDASKGRDKFSNKSRADNQKIKLDINIKLITDDGVQAGLYSIVKHKNLTVYPLICSHKEHKCNRKIIWDEKEESIKRPVEEKGLMTLSKREQPKLKMVCGQRKCDHTNLRKGKIKIRPVPRK